MPYRGEPGVLSTVRWKGAVRGWWCSLQLCQCTALSHPTSRARCFRQADSERDSCEWDGSIPLPGMSPCSSVSCIKPSVFPLATRQLGLSEGT
ncbi:hypothetical protein BDZ91DRAFT_515688 [Kalaharituber pfeilii]|nr:hypothetical protein BDZ91DRAFT_515688 [Kalaharituber pfeilii]